MFSSCRRNFPVPSHFLTLSMSNEILCCTWRLIIIKNQRQQTGQVHVVQCTLETVEGQCHVLGLEPSSAALRSSLPAFLPSLSALWTLEICCKSMRIIWPRQLAWFALTGDWQKLIKKPLQGVCLMPHASCCRPTNLAERRIQMRECSMQSFSPPEFSNANECWCCHCCVGRPFAWARARFPLEMDTPCERCSWLSCPKRAGKISKRKDFTILKGFWEIQFKFMQLLNNK